MKETPSHIEIAYSSIPIFLNDGTVDMEELNFLIGLALRDDKIDEDEKRVLKSIFDKVPKDKTSKKVLERIQEIRTKYSI